jgi:light-regulated signal transduction histidine kinase (bacteriophytochrome)
MPKLKATTCKELKDNLANYSLLEIIHHVVGNGLAVITGYTQLLQRLVSPLEQQHMPLGPDRGKQHHEKGEFYLQTIAQGETQLNDFLAHIRGLSLYPANARFCQTLLKTDLTFLVKRTTDRLLPLYKSQKVQCHWTAQPLYVMCDPLWIELVLEHVISHNIAFHSGSTPVKIDLLCYHDRDSSPPLHEIQVGVHITKRYMKRRKIAAKNVFEVWSQTLDQRDQDVCMALCDEILQEHGGRIWSEQNQGRKESMYVSLPLIAV